MAHGPVTIGDLKRECNLLERLCSNCNRHLYEEPGKFPFRDSNPAPRLDRCPSAQGGLRNTPIWVPIHCWPDARIPTASLADLGHHQDQSPDWQKLGVPLLLLKEDLPSRHNAASSQIDPYQTLHCIVSRNLAGDTSWFGG